MTRRTDTPAVPCGFPDGRRANLPYLIGVCLAVNAIRDLWLVVDGPDCSHFKGQYIFGKHDWYSTLFRVDGRHRIVFTGTGAQDVTGNRDRLIARTLHKAMLDEAAAVVLTAMPLCVITGAQYDRIVAALDATRPVIEVPGRSLRGDWLDGYAATLDAVARARRLPRVRRRRDAVALVGYLWDRNEGDHVGNRAELTRLLGALGLELVAVWPGGGPWAELDAVARAGTILSLPFGRAAARTLAERTGARLVETGVPIGIAGTRTWLEEVAAAFGRSARAARLIAAETERLAARLARVIPFYFLNRGAALVCDPHQLGGLVGLCTDLGFHVRFTAALGRAAHAPAGVRDGAADAVPVEYEPLLGASPVPRLRAAGLDGGDLLICNGELAQACGPSFAVVEFGVPSYGHHALADAPFLGFDGALRLADRMAHALSAAYGRVAGP